MTKRGELSYRQWWGKTAKGPIFLALSPGLYAIAEGVRRTAGTS